MRAPSLSETFRFRPVREAPGDDDPYGGLDDDELERLTAPKERDPRAAFGGHHGAAPVSQVAPGAGLRRATKPQTRAAASPPPSSPGAAPPKPRPPMTQPKFPGTFVGQVARLGGRYVSKPVSFPDRFDPSIRRYGQVQGKEDDELAVWTGTAWARPDEFDALVRAGKVRAR